MIRLTDSIAPTYGNPEDIAPIQVLLARARHRLRPFWRGEIDGNMTPALRTAIEMFQYEAGILAPPLREDPGWIHPGGPTFTALKAAVPASLHRIRVLPGTAEVFMAQRSTRILKRELDRAAEILGSRDPGDTAEILRLIEETHDQLGLHLQLVEHAVVEGERRNRFGVRGLSQPLPGGVFHTVTAANPWMVPDAFWRVIQTVAPAHLRFLIGEERGHGWMVTDHQARDAA